MSGGILGRGRENSPWLSDHVHIEMTRRRRQWRPSIIPRLRWWWQRVTCRHIWHVWDFIHRSHITHLAGMNRDVDPYFEVCWKCKAVRYAGPEGGP